MFRACLVGFACWVAAGAFGLLDDTSAHTLAAYGGHIGFVTEPAGHDARVTESQPLAWSALADRPAPGAARASGRRVDLLLRTAQLRFGVQPLSGSSHDVRVASRTRAVARRPIDLRREAFRIRPGRRVGGVEAAPEPLA